MKNVFSFSEFITEELTKLPTEYKFTKNEEEDKKHNRLASKKKDDHKWVKKSSKKHGTKSMTQLFTCKCGYEKTVENDENKNVTITYKKK